MNTNTQNWTELEHTKLGSEAEKLKEEWNIISHNL